MQVEGAAVVAALVEEEEEVVMAAPLTEATKAAAVTREKCILNE